MMQAALQPSMYKCAVGYIGVYDLNLLAKPENNRNDERTASWMRKFIGADKAQIDRISPVNQAARIKAPVLLVHGGKDKRAPLEHGERMRDALAKAGNPPEWFLAPDEGHGFYDPKNVTEFYTRLRPSSQSTSSRTRRSRRKNRRRIGSGGGFSCPRCAYFFGYLIVISFSRLSARSTSFITHSM